MYLGPFDIEKIEKQLEFYNKINNELEEFPGQLVGTFPKLKDLIQNFVENVLDFDELSKSKDYKKEIIVQFNEEAFSPWIEVQVENAQRQANEWLCKESKIQFEESFLFFIPSIIENLTKDFSDFSKQPELSLNKDMFGKFSLSSRESDKQILTKELTNFSQNLVFGLDEEFKNNCILIKLQGLFTKAIEDKISKT